jgi:hypothetical protein
MRYKFLLTLVAITLGNAARAQAGHAAHALTEHDAEARSDGSKLSHRHQQYHKLSVSFNWLGIGEPAPAVGLGVGYQLSRHWQVWAEGSRLLPASFTSHFSVRPGFRLEMAVKYYFGERKNCFVGGEVRWKELQYLEHERLVNPTTHDTLSHYNQPVWNRMPGAAVLAGIRTNPFGHGHCWMEVNVGFGLKYRSVQIGGLPPGYIRDRGIIDHLNPEEIDPEQKGWFVYVPATMRFVYAF